MVWVSFYHGPQGAGQYHIHNLSKVGKDKAVWAKADEYLTNLMDSDTMITLENTNDAIKRAENYMQRQDTDGDKRVAFSSAVDGSTDGQVNTLRAALKEKDQCLSALEAKFDRFSRGQTDGSNKRKKTAKKNEKECNYCKKTGKWFQGHDESECLHKKKDEAEVGLLAIKERRERAVKGRQATKGEKKAFAAVDDQHSKVSTSLPVTSPHPVALSATATLEQRRVRHGTVDTAAQLHVCRRTREG
jgi:hypothetical protein